MFILRQAELNPQLKMSALAKSLKIKSDELIKYLTSDLDMDIQLYLRLIELLKADLDEVVFCKENIKNARFVSKFESAIKNGKDAIDALYKQKTNLFEEDSYGYYLLEYAMEQKNIEIVDYILSKKYFKLCDDHYLKKHPINTDKELEYCFHVLVFILKYQLKSHYALIVKFNQYNHGILSNLSEEYKYAFLYYLDKNQMSEMLDLIFKQKVKSNILTAKAGEEPFNYFYLTKYAIQYHFNFLASYLGKVMVEFKDFILEADKNHYPDGILAFIQNMDSENLKKMKGFKTDAQSIFMKYCKEKNNLIVQNLIDKKIYGDVNEGFDNALKENNEALYQYIIQHAYEDIDKNNALTMACKTNHFQLIELFLKDASDKTKNEVLKNVKDDPKTMVLLLKSGAKFENHSKSLPQMNLVIQYLIQGEDKVSEEEKNTHKKRKKNL